MKFLHIITLATLFITFTSAQNIDDIADEGNVSEVSDIVEPRSFSFSVGSNEDEEFGVVKHDGEDLIRVIKTVNGHLTTEYFTVVDVDVKSESEDGQSDEEASIINEEVFENYFANLEELDLEDLN